MVAKALLDDVLSLPTEDRLALIEHVWASLRGEPDGVPLTDAQRTELDRRVADMESAPDDESEWTDVQARFLSTRREPTK
jgi:putative addiction module component (TIGR02574 family)